MKDGIEITNEPNPILREIYAIGYDDVFLDRVNNVFVLIDNVKKYCKEIPYRSFNLSNYTVISGILPDGKRHAWISESDGSCERLRQIIKQDIV